MKKLIYLLLPIVAASITSCGCSNNQSIPTPPPPTMGLMSGEYVDYTEDEMVNAAVELDGDDLWDEIFNDREATKAKYEGTVVKITSVVRVIAPDKVIISDEVVNGNPKSTISVYLDEEDLKKLSVGDKITVVGGINDVATLPSMRKCVLVEHIPATE